MATTPNYSWPTPDNTDLVRDGALAIRDLGDAIDTTVGEIDVATTKGDLIAFDGTDYDRLGVGTNGQVLLADSVEPLGVKWGSPGGMTLLASGNLTTGTVSVTGIPAGYNELAVRAVNVVASTTATLRLGMNSLAGSNEYQWLYIDSSSSTVNVSTSQANMGFLSSGTATGTSTVPGTNFYATITSYDQPAENGRVLCRFIGWSRQASTSRFMWSTVHSGPLTSIQISLSTGTFTAGTYEVWGVK